MIIYIFFLLFYKFLYVALNTITPTHPYIFMKNIDLFSIKMENVTQKKIIYNSVIQIPP